VAFVEKHKEDPFLLLFAPNNVHVPVKPGADFVGKSGCGLYGDYVMELDWMVGEVLAVIDRNGLTGKTLVLFTSDNGGGYYKPEAAEACARGHRLNGNLLGQKTELWEGGHRVPLIVRWPGRVQPGMQSDCQVSLVDVMATMAEALNFPLPADAGPDSYSFLYALTGATPPATRRESQVYQGYHKGSLAIRQGPWVLIRN
jgi:arylsulfatase A-like enzyme